MKKYVKPELFYEDFELSQNIAACGVDMQYTDGNTCKGTLDFNLDNKGTTVIFAKDEVCGSTVGAEQYCYMPGTATDDTFKLFVS